MFVLDFEKNNIPYFLPPKCYSNLLIIYSSEEMCVICDVARGSRRQPSLTVDLFPMTVYNLYLIFRTVNCI